MLESKNYDRLPSHPAAAESPCDINTEREPPNASLITVTWPEPTTGATPTGYMIYYWPVGIHDDLQIQPIEGGNTTTAVINVNSTKLEYAVTIITLSDMLPSKPSPLIIYSES